MGFTLIESVVVVAVAAVLLAAAVPTFRNLILDMQMKTEVNDLIFALYYTRSEAIKRNHVVELCVSSDLQTCDTQGKWSDGWLMFEDSDNDHQKGANEALIHTHGPLKSDIAYSPFPNYTKRYVTYYANGRSRVNGTFVFCDERGANSAHALIMYRSGRFRTSRKRPDGSDLSCQS